VDASVSPAGGPINENPWLQIPLHAVYEHAPPLAESPIRKAWSFRLRRPRARHANFDIGGLRSAPLSPRWTLKWISLPEERSRTRSYQSYRQGGPARRALADQPDDIQAAALESIRRVLTPHASEAGVTLPGAVWLVAADRSV